MNIFSPLLLRVLVYLITAILLQYSTWSCRSNADRPRILPKIENRPRIFHRPPVAPAASSSADSAAPASASGTPGSLTYPCTCRVCMCKGPDYHVTEEESERIKEDLKKLGSQDFDYQVQVVSLTEQVEALQKENEALKEAQKSQVISQVYAAPARPTYTNYYNNTSQTGNCQGGQCSVRRGLFGRR